MEYAADFINSHRKKKCCFGFHFDAIIMVDQLLVEGCKSTEEFLMIGQSHPQMRILTDQLPGPVFESEECVCRLKKQMKIWSHLFAVREVEWSDEEHRSIKEILREKQLVVRNYFSLYFVPSVASVRCNLKQMVIFYLITSMHAIVIEFSSLYFLLLVSLIDTPFNVDASLSIELTQMRHFQQHWRRCLFFFYLLGGVYVYYPITLPPCVFYTMKSKTCQYWSNIFWLNS